MKLWCILGITIALERTMRFRPIVIPKMHHNFIHSYYGSLQSWRQTHKCVGSVVVVKNSEVSNMGGAVTKTNLLAISPIFHGVGK